MKRSDLIDIADERLREARLLLDNGHWSGAYYLSGYSVELCLKAIIARQFKADEIPQKSVVNAIYCHKLDELLNLADLKTDLDGRRKTEPGFAANWNTVKGWNESARYEKTSEEQARAMLKALSDPTDGVSPWIRSKL